MIGFRPMRCSSVAQTSTGLSGCFAASSVTTAASFFKHLALLRRGPGRMARARLLHRPADRLQGLPAALRQDRREPEFAGHPSRHFGASPQATVGRRRRKPLGQPRQKLRAQHARCAAVAPTQVTQSLGAMGVVAGQQLLNPARDKARHRGDIRDGVTPREQPDHLNVPRRGRILGRPEPRFQILDAQMISNPRHGSPPRLMAHQPTRFATAQESKPSPSPGIRIRGALAVHLKETEGQVKRLEQVFQIVGERPEGVECQAIQGIIEEGQEILQEFECGEALDAGLIAAAQAVEHYEITRYGTLLAWAKQLGLSDAEELLKETLVEEENTDAVLSELAEEAINPAAAA